MTHKFLTKNNIQKILLLLPAAVLLFLTLYRLFFGTELTDEAYYLAMSKSFINGVRPFADSWDSTQTSALFMVPFLLAYRAVTGGTEGMFLFCRIIFFVLNLAVAAAGYFAVKKYTGSILAVYIMVILVTYAPFSLYTVSYNNLTYTLLLLGTFFLISAFPGKEIDGEASGKRVLVISAGAVHALMAFFYPYMVILCIITGVLIVPVFVYCRQKKNVLKTAVLYVAGGAGTAIILLLILIFMTGSVTGIIEGIDGILLNALYGRGGSISVARQIPASIMGALERQKLTYGILLIPPVIYFIKKTGKIFPAVKLIPAVVPVAAYLYVRHIHIPASSHTMLDYTFIAGTVAPVALYFLIDKEKQNARKLFWLLWVPGFFGFLIVSYSSGGTYVQAPWIMPGGLLLSAIYVVFLFREHSGNITEKRLYSIFPLITCIAFSVCNIYMHYDVIYRDDDIGKLDVTVEHGIYRGVKTTQQRKTELEETEALIKSLDRSGQKLLVIENAPFAYLFSDMQPSSPNLWAATWYILGVPDCTQVFEYYKDNEKIPDLIYLFYPGDYSYGADPNYGLHIWLQNNYNLVYDYAGTDNIIPFYAYEKTDGR